MSLGNLKTDGQGGKNTPWQQTMVGMLVQIRNLLSSSPTSAIYPKNSEIATHLIEELDNTTLRTSYNAWIAANPTFKVVSITQVNSISDQSILITYIP